MSFRKELAKKAFQHTCYYDAAISDYFLNCKNGIDRFQINEGIDSDSILFHLKKIKQLKYGENPHQKANVYVNLRDNLAPTLLENQIQGGKFHLIIYSILKQLLDVPMNLRKMLCYCKA